jgi:hypothetical protein
MSNSDILPTPYRILVEFDHFIPAAGIKRELFKVEEKDSGTVLPILSVRVAGQEQQNADVREIKNIYLDAEYHADRSYLVTVLFVNENPKTLEVAPYSKTEAANEKTPKSPLNFHYRFLSVDLNPFAADDDNAFGLKYDVRYQIKRGYIGGGVLNVDLQTHGEFSITPEKDSTNSIQSSIKGGLTASYLYNFPFTLPLKDESRTYVYPLGFRVSPAEFEADKGFDNVNYTAKVRVGGAIPYADYPALLWTKMFNVNVPFFAPTLFTGFTALSEVKDDGSDNLAKLGHTRWDTEFLYFVPLHRRVDFKFSWSLYVGLENSFSKDNYEVGAVVYMDDKRTHGFTLSRQKGALPPDFKETESWRLGYTAKF